MATGTAGASPSSASAKGLPVAAPGDRLALLIRYLRGEISGRETMGLHSYIRKAQIKYYGRFGTVQVPEKWAFLVGSTNSGSTLLKEVLASHPRIASMHREGQHYTDVFFKPGQFQRLWALAEGVRMDETNSGHADAERLKRQWCGQLNDLNRPVFLEKSPPNSLRTRWLQAHFPNAHFVGIIRDGYAIAEGIRRKTGHAIDLAARQWAKCNEILLADFEHLEHKLLLRYEEMTEAPEATFQKICEFLGIDPGQTAYLNDKVWKIQKVKSPIRNMNEKSFQALTLEDRAVIEKEAGKMLDRLGYRNAG